MSRPAHSHAAAQEPPSIIMENSWHCLHMYYQVDQKELNALSEGNRHLGTQELIDLFNPEREGVPTRMQTHIVSGHRADLGLIMMDPDPLVIDAIRHGVRASHFGTALKPTYSFVSMTEISEYVATPEQYATRLKQEGLVEGDEMFEAKLNAYEKRLPVMNKQRIFPDFPPYPSICFYPMNKIRDPHANWYVEPFSSRSKMMAEHATSGIKFAGKVSQVITASTGMDDWEWGVTLWGKNPQYIKDIVYTMRFDEASAKYAEFGEFYFGYVMPIEEALQHMKIIN